MSVTMGTLQESVVKGTDNMLEVDAAPSGDGAPLARQMRNDCGIELPPEPRDVVLEDETVEKTESAIGKEEGEREAQEECVESGFETLPGEEMSRVRGQAQNGQGQGCGPNPCSATAPNYMDEDEAKVKIQGAVVRPKHPVGIAAVFPANGISTAPAGPDNASGQVRESPSSSSISSTTSTTSTTSTASSSIPSSAGAQQEEAEADSEAEEHYDVLLLHSEEDEYHRKEFLAIADMHAWKVTAQSDFPPNQTRFRAFSSALQRSSYTVLLLTDAFLRDCWLQIQYQTALTKSIEDPARHCSVIPVICQDDLVRPDELTIYIGIKSSSLHYQKSLKKTIDTRKRRVREKAAGVTSSASSAATSSSSSSQKSQQLTTPNAALPSVNDIYLGNRPELKPDLSVVKVLPDGVYRHLCLNLDRDNPLNRNWILFADSLGFSRDIIDSMRKERSPTAAVITCFCQQGFKEGRTRADIWAALRRSLEDCQRKDCLQILDNSA